MRNSQVAGACLLLVFALSIPQKISATTNTDVTTTAEATTTMMTTTAAQATTTADATAEPTTTEFATTTFSTTAPLVNVEAEVTLSGMTSSEFTSARQTSFKTVLASEITAQLRNESVSGEVIGADVSITGFTDVTVRRRLLATALQVSALIIAPTGAVHSTAAAVRTSASSGSLASSLSSAGFPAGITATATATPVPANTFDPTTYVVQVCFANGLPFVDCNSGMPRADWGGYDVNVWRALADAIQVSWTAQCFASKEDLIFAMQAGQCDLGMSGITISSHAVEVYKWDFSPPTLRSGWAIMARRRVIQEEEYGFQKSAWRFLKGFDEDLWWTIVLTTFVTAVVFLVYESFDSHNEEFPRHLLHGGSEALYAAWATCLTMATEKPISTWPSRLAMLSFQFLLLIVGATYTADLASQLTSIAAFSSIAGPSDLVQNGVMTTEEFMPGLKELNAIPQLMPFNTSADVFEMMTGLKKRKTRAIVLARPIIEFYATGDCDVYVVPGEWKTTYFGIAFPRARVRPTGLMNTINTALMELREKGWLTNMKKRYISAGKDGCNVATGSDGFEWMEMRGLWYIWMIALGVGFVAVITVSLLRTNPVVAAVVQDAISFMSLHHHFAEEKDTRPPRLQEEEEQQALLGDTKKQGSFTAELCFPPLSEVGEDAAIKELRQGVAELKRHAARQAEKIAELQRRRGIKVRAAPPSPAETHSMAQGTPPHLEPPRGSATWNEFGLASTPMLERPHH